MRFVENKIRGFHLIELMITLGIISILAAICLPIYSEHFVREGRLEAEEVLSRVAVAMEEYHIGHNSYRGAGLGELGFREWILEHHYRLVIEGATDSGYLLKAEGDESECGAILLSSSGERSCW